MIEKIKTTPFLSTPAQEVLRTLDSILSPPPAPLNVAEIGVGVGATSVEIVKRLRSEDCFYFFSYQDEVDELYEDLKSLPYRKCRLVPMGNTRSTFDSYNWTLAKLILENPEKSPLFDLVYLDASHNFFNTGLGCVLLKKMTRPSGYLIFDDVYWSYEKNFVKHFPNAKFSQEISNHFSNE